MNSVIILLLSDDDHPSLKVQLEVSLVKVGRMEEFTVVNSLDQVSLDCVYVIHESVRLILDETFFLNNKRSSFWVVLRH